jgi:hypothetical protein
MNTRNILKRIARKDFMHPKFKEALDRAYSQAAFAECDSVIMVLGATRVGKTTLSHVLERQLVSADALGGVDIPLIRVEAATTDQGFISSRYLSLRMLQALKHPFYDDEGYRPRWQDSETMLRARLDKALRGRGTRYVFVDEAHHLLRTKSVRAIGSVLDTFKCLANEAGVVLVLFGGYELLRTCFESAHLNGRSIVINFKNYGRECADIDIYDRILATLDPVLPWRSGQSLIKHRELIYEGTLGCYGLLVRWVMTSIAEMAASGARALTERHLLNTRLREQLVPIREDLELGSQLMHELESTSSTPMMARGRRKPTKCRRKPGTRKPTRDPVAKY